LNKKVEILRKSNFFVNLPGKIEIVLTRIHDPQISNQIDAAVESYHLEGGLIIKVIRNPVQVKY